VLQSQEISVEKAVPTLEIAPQTYNRWREEYGDMKPTQACKLKDVERKNLQLKKLVADLSLDNAILKEVGACMPSQKSVFPGLAQTSSGPRDGDSQSVRAMLLPGDWTAQNNPRYPKRVDEDEEMLREQTVSFASQYG